MTALMLVGCKTTTVTSTVTPIISPTQKSSTLIPILTPNGSTATPAPPYFHFTPSENSNIHLEFDYPSSWVFSEDFQDFQSIYLLDPRFLTLPTPSSDDYHPIPNDFGFVCIWIIPSKPGQTPATELESHKISYNNHFRYREINDYKITVDGYDASVLEYKVDPAQDDYPSVMFYRRTYFMVNSQVYEIIFTVAEKERGGEFEQGYEYFFNSLKIVP
jgi:hypothetical protein